MAAEMALTPDDPIVLPILDGSGIGFVDNGNGLWVPPPPPITSLVVKQLELTPEEKEIAALSKSITSLQQLMDNPPPMKAAPPIPAKPAWPKVSDLPFTAAPLKQHRHIETALVEAVPALTKLVECPDCTDTDGYCYTTNLSQMIQHFNDVHRWSREKIADHLETLPLDLTFQPTSIGD